MRKSLEEYRQLAIDILRPSEKELAHGLELHRNSFVFDSYGFMPLGGNDYDFDGNQMTKAGRTEFRWATESYRMNGAFRDPATVERLKEAWEWAGVDCIFQNSGEEGNDIEQLIKRLACYTHVTDMLPELYERVVFPEQLAGLRERGKKALYMTTNGVPLPSKLFSVEDALTYIGVFFKLGIRMMHLTYNRRNLIGDGCSEAANGGLSAFGREVIAEMNRVGVIPDVAHSGLRTSSDGDVINSEFPGNIIYMVDERFYIHLILQKRRMRANTDKTAAFFDRLNNFITFRPPAGRKTSGYGMTGYHRLL